MARECLPFYLTEEVVWALLRERDQKILYIPGLTVKRASATYRGESKTDARDAHVIADQVRMRSDLDKLEPGEEEVAQLRILLRLRRDLLRGSVRRRVRLDTRGQKE